MPWLESLQRLVGRSEPVNETRWVVLDVETSGLDIHRDRLLAIAAIAIRVDWASKTLRVDLGDSFEVVLRQDEGQYSSAWHWGATAKRRHGPSSGPECFHELCR